MEIPQEIWNVDSGQSGFLLPFIIGGLIMPIVEGLKKTVLVNWVRPEFLTGSLAIAIAFAIEAIAQSGIDPSEIVKNAFVSVGVATTMFGSHKATKATKKMFKKVRKL